MKATSCVLTLTLLVSLTTSAPTQPPPSSGSLQHHDTPAVGATDRHSADKHLPPDPATATAQNALPGSHGENSAAPFKAEASTSADGIVTFGMIFTVELPPFINVGGKKYRLSIRMPGSSGAKVH
ncbi:uncharacterized protein LOC124274351 isoform X2 [Haliotis rubra]|uniref:uncharacterized protein LOC124274351 isoform X2 n=1 Tax=Haliotis rubra TaxID=36100 RepID=UPI001EE61A61|nr:uncharacterized protein LOC124274351 isoform X2 [Haliotis rubra]